ncbi:MAG: diphthine--ammonia ligase [Chloroflexota bacterium]
MTGTLLMAWSGGKDSALALYEVQQRLQQQVVSLLTTITSDYDRVSMHGIRRSLVEQQAEHLGLSLHEVFIGKEATNEEYETKMEASLITFQHEGVSSVVFGDVHLQDVRRYREDNLAKVGMTALFPLWGRNPASVTGAFLQLGFKAIVTCVDARVLDRSFCGRMLDESFISNLPAHVDPCGENGEFHSFVFDGPAFLAPVPFRVGEVVERNSLFYCDLLPTHTR